ncbi:zinc ribbon domain-containing protein [Methanosphaera cuniculi]|uniref:zinc ribbon domain-containing protein n=1 Tax=Methanosphaera cuniculi TaxID=1077256 RepID=UPI0026F287B1|nr:zinc ribbon domain-containing protein [Methanosphaera cuniculi]
MKCPECGAENNDNSERCNVCNAILPASKSQNHKEYIQVKFKNKYLATILSAIVGFFFIFDGVGQLYLGLYKRFAVECGISIVLNLISYYIVFFISMTIGMIVYILPLIWLIYTTYDTYICADALTTGRSIPLLFGRDIQ